MKIKDIARISLVAALYVAITLGMGTISFGMLQLRMADGFLLLCLYDKKYIYSNAIGVFFANIFSPLGVIDVVVGVVVQIICGITSFAIRDKWVYSAVCSLIVGFGVGTEIWFIYRGDYWINVIGVIFSTSVVLCFGCVLLKYFDVIRSKFNVM